MFLQTVPLQRCICERDKIGGDVYIFLHIVKPTFIKFSLFSAPIIKEYYDTIWLVFIYYNILIDHSSLWLENIVTIIEIWLSSDEHLCKILNMNKVLKETIRMCSFLLHKLKCVENYFTCLTELFSPLFILFTLMPCLKI